MPKSSAAANLRKLGDNVRRIRSTSGITQEKLAELAEINARTVRRIEAGEINILITTVARIRTALGCSWNDLLPDNWQ